MKKYIFLIQMNKYLHDNPEWDYIGRNTVFIFNYLDS